MGLLPFVDPFLHFGPLLADPWQELERRVKLLQCGGISLFVDGEMLAKIFSNSDFGTPLPLIRMSESGDLSESPVENSACSFPLDILYMIVERPAIVVDHFFDHFKGCPGNGAQGVQEITVKVFPPGATQCR